MDSRPMSGERWSLGVLLGPEHRVARKGHDGAECFSQTESDILAVQQVPSMWAVTPDSGCACWGCSRWGDDPY